MIADRNDFGQHNLDLIETKLCTVLTIMYRT